MHVPGALVYTCGNNVSGQVSCDICCSISFCVWYKETNP